MTLFLNGGTEMCLTDEQLRVRRKYLLEVDERMLAEDIREAQLLIEELKADLDALMPVEERLRKGRLDSRFEG